MDALFRNPPVAATRVGLVMAAVRSRIDARAIGRGAKLPSVRKFAEQLGVSKSTVVEAYDRLAAEGIVEARRGSGFYVATASPPLVLAAAPPSLNPGIDLLAIMRNALESRPDMLQPGAGWLPESWLPVDSVERALRAVSRGPASAKLRYDPPRGLEPLRRVIAARLTERGAPVDPAQILLTDSATHGLDLAARFFLSPGDCVVIDDPHYFNIVQLLDVHRAKIVLAPFLRDGPDLAALESVFAEHRPRLYLTVAGPHNPTGAALTPSHAHRALQLAERHDVVILEDDIYCDFEPTPSPRLATFDGYDRVVQVGGYSKTVSAALRTGYIAARSDWADALVDLKLATSLGHSSLAANILHRVLTEGSYRRHIDALRPRLAEAIGLTIRRLKSLGVTPWIEPRGGMFLWAQLPDGLDAVDVAKAALEENVVFAPGRAFSPSPQWRDYMRFNVALSAEPRVFESLDRAMTRAKSQGR